MERGGREADGVRLTAAPGGGIVHPYIIWNRGKRCRPYYRPT
jgi:hypothetical protein